ncbi:hypothetical protein IV102_15800 [bacterium]|nr:hypothetical protein [bacterium]
MKLRRRGIVIVACLILLMVTLMVVGAGLALGPANLAAGTNVADQLRARQAAESGVQYAITRLRLNSDWKGDANQITVNSPDMYVEEDRGNVIGLVRDSGGQWSQFRIRFNYQDGAGAEGLDDPAQFVFTSPYVSVNNLGSSQDVQAPRADGPGYSVQSNSPRPYTVPRWSVLMAVEGRAGRVAATPTNPEGATTGFTKATLETLLQVPNLMSVNNLDAAAMVAGNFSANVGTGGLVSVEGKSGRTPRLRSRAAVSVAGGASQNYTSTQGKVTSSSGTLSASYDTNQVGVSIEDPTDPFYQLIWSDVRKAPSSASKWDAGTYVWWQDGTLHYYDMNYADYVTYIQANPNDSGAAAVVPGQVVSDTAGAYKILRLTSSVDVQATSNTDEFNILTRRGAAEDPVGGAANYVLPIATYAASNCPLFMSTFNPLPGSMTVQDSSGNPVFSASWNYSGPPSPATYSSSVSSPQASIIQIHQFLIDPTVFPQWTLTQSTNFTPPTAAAIQAWGTAQGVTFTAGAAPGEINPNLTDSLTASDLRIEFAGGNQPVTLAGPGNMRLTGSILGSGGSIVSAGNLSITGLGADFSANQANGVNLYSCGDITFSSLDEVTSGQYAYQDVHLKGIVYSWGDFVAKLSHSSLPAQGTFKMDGMLITYGGDPAGQPGTNSGKGNVSLDSGQVNFVFDPSYLNQLATKLPSGFKLKSVSWNQLP